MTIKRATDDLVSPHLAPDNPDHLDRVPAEVHLILPLRQYASMDILIALELSVPSVALAWESAKI